MNRKLLFLSFLFLIGLSTKAQEYYGNPYDFNRSLVAHVNRDKAQVTQHGIESRTVEKTEFSSEGAVKKNQVSMRFFYNQAGQILREEWYQNSGKLERANVYHYNDQGQVVKKQTFYRTSLKAKSTVEMTYHNDSLLASIQYTNRKGKNSWGYRYFYNTRNQIIEQRGYRKGQLDGRIEYDYYDDHQKKEVRYFKDSLKLTRTFRYDCGIGNSLLSQKQKDTLTQCTRKEELADGTQRRIEETRDEKGRIIRTVYDYNPIQKWSETRAYNAKNQIRYRVRWETVESGKHWSKYEFYRRGKARMTRTSLNWQDSFGFSVSEHHEKGQVEKRYQSSYTFFVKN
ncbi:MAG: hypothetical protein LPK45_08790 [Bacteroidota bacterium]|nr:hypothetical protein [Bacteroidota bacterium]MDX5431181.1 hypothetical protein [Bacteroidota bacterium]MDX5469920.1 hypothetical protein [Bacteroidota bacterium]